ncbi:hypothetical protein QU487_06590 [Crenobacter sp. SG2305]|uniref:hypothetical protein n=1 Tax=Crenobacter oryzisoli TaxID=3056844 RepID=UPI0025AAEF36|nr:hypothetical protein [Crenobacter sp. SG2305]MDN0082421.1 hypothetical protein [Crenobacter sp. SG2305]
MKMTAVEKKERQKELFMAGPAGMWIRIGQKIGYGKAFLLLCGTTALFLAAGSLIK